MTIGVITILFGLLAIAVDLRVRLTQSLPFRAYVAKTYTNPDLERYRRRMVFALLPVGVWATAGGLWEYLGRGYDFLIIPVVIGFAAQFGLMFLGIPDEVKPGWFRLEEANGFPIVALWDEHQEEWKRAAPFWERVLLPAAFLTGGIAALWLMLGGTATFPAGPLLIGLGSGLAILSAQRAAKRRKKLGLKTPIEPPD
ncbi:MAG: hypothetical protein QOE92_1660 [Chloroflexota bacterium]|jgi:hypothetical protein|nr:hypothetical protein [Chloroflexota bacterium]